MIADRPSFLHAATFEVAGATFFSVYRSPALRTTDDWYKPVEEYIFLKEPDLMWQKTVKDDSMMFGRAEQTMWKMKEYM